MLGTKFLIGGGNDERAMGRDFVPDILRARRAVPAVRRTGDLDEPGQYGDGRQFLRSIGHRLVRDRAGVPLPARETLSARALLAKP